MTLVAYILSSTLCLLLLTTAAPPSPMVSMSSYCLMYSSSMKKGWISYGYYCNKCEGRLLNLLWFACFIIILLWLLSSFLSIEKLPSTVSLSGISLSGGNYEDYSPYLFIFEESTVMSNWRIFRLPKIFLRFSFSPVLPDRSLVPETLDKPSILSCFNPTDFD